MESPFLQFLFLQSNFPFYNLEKQDGPFVSMLKYCRQMETDSFYCFLCLFFILVQPGASKISRFLSLHSISLIFILKNKMTQFLNNLSFFYGDQLFSSFCPSIFIPYNIIPETLQFFLFKLISEFLSRKKTKWSIHLI